MMNQHQETFAAAATLFEARGFAVTPPRGNHYWGKHMVCAEHDRVPYCMRLTDCFGELNPNKLDPTLNHRALIIQRHHAKVKGVYEYLVSKDIGDIWVMCGGGTQLQAFFGNSKGYIAILYLTMVEDLRHISDYLTAVGREQFTLVVQSAENDKHFDNFDVAGVRLRTFRANFPRDIS